MTVLEEDKTKAVIDLSANEGNVFVLIGLLYRHAKLIKSDPKALTDEMMAGDFGKAVEIFKRELGDYYDVKLPQKLVKSAVLKNNRENEVKHWSSVDGEPTMIDN